METTIRRTRMERSTFKVCIRVKDLEPVQQDRSNRDRNHSKAIIVGVGSQLSSMSESRGLGMEGLKWGRGTSKPGKGSQGRKEAVNGDKGGWGEGGSQYYNPDPLCRLIGPKNEVQVVVNDEEVTGLVDSGAQISAVSLAFTAKHDLPIWQLQQLLDFKGFGWVEIPYIGYTQIQLKIPGIQ